MIKGVHLTNFEKKIDRKLIFFLIKKGIHIVYLKKQKYVYVTILLFILYSIGVHVESSKDKMIWLKSPKSSEFAIYFNKQW